MRNILFKSFLAIFLINSLCFLTACGGGGGGSKTPSTVNVRINVPGDLFDIPAESTRASKLPNKLIVRATPFADGNINNDIKPISVEASYKDDDSYRAELKGLSIGFDYRFSTIYDGKELLKNHVSVASITNDAAFNVNIRTTFKTLAYEKWINSNPSIKTFKNFMNEAAKVGLKEDTDFEQVYSYITYKENLTKIIKGQEASLPKADDVDISKIPVTSESSFIPADNLPTAESLENVNVVLLENKDLQIESIKNVAKFFINYLNGKISENSSIRFSESDYFRASLTQNFTGKDIIVLSGINASNIKESYIINHPDTFATFKKRIKYEKNIIDRNALDFLIVDAGAYNIGFYNSWTYDVWEGKYIRILSYFAIDKSKTEIKGTAYIISKDCMTFCFRVTKDSIEGKTFKNDFYDIHYQSSNSVVIAEVSGNNENFTYGDQTDIKYE